MERHVEDSLSMAATGEGKVLLDPRVEDCLSVLLVAGSGNGEFSMSRVLNPADDDDGIVTILVKDNMGRVPEYGLVDCFEEDSDSGVVLRGDNDW